MVQAGRSERHHCVAGAARKLLYSTSSMDRGIGPLAADLLRKAARQPATMKLRLLASASLQGEDGARSARRSNC